MREYLRSASKAVVSGAAFFVTVVSLSVWYAAYSALSNVNSGDVLNKDAWNQMVANLSDHETRISSLASESGCWVPGTFSKLEVDNVSVAAPASQVSIRAWAVCLWWVGGSRLASNVNVTVSKTSTGPNGLDTWSVAASKWYSVWVIHNGSTVAGLLSLSTASPTLPSWYSYAARVGWVRTDGSSNFLRFKQSGNEVAFINTGGGLPTLASGSAGNYSTPTWVAVPTAGCVPPTASVIRLVTASSGLIMVAPNNSHGAWGDYVNPASLWWNTGNGNHPDSVDLTLESSNVYWTASTAASYLKCRGWEDNL